MCIYIYTDMLRCLGTTCQQRSLPWHQLVQTDVTLATSIEMHFGISNAQLLC